MVGHIFVPQELVTHLPFTLTLLTCSFVIPTKVMLVEERVGCFYNDLVK